MDQVTAEINFIKLALGSFEDYTDENERKSALKNELDAFDANLQKQLKGYVRLSEDKLERLLEELQKKENLLQEEKNKQLGSSTSN